MNEKLHDPFMHFKINECIFFQYPESGSVGIVRTSDHVCSQFDGFCPKYDIRFEILQSYVHLVVTIVALI